MFISSIMVIILQCLHILYYHVVYLKCIQCLFVNDISKTRRNKEHQDRELRNWPKITPFLSGRCRIRIQALNICLLEKMWMASISSPNDFILFQFSLKYRYLWLLFCFFFHFHCLQGPLELNSDHSYLILFSHYRYVVT